MTKKYQDIYKRSIKDPRAFWSEIADNIFWYKKPSKILNSNKPPFYKWYEDGITNTCYNAVDLHVKNGNGKKIAIIYDSPITNSQKKITYSQLKDKESKFEGAVVNQGIAVYGNKGSTDQHAYVQQLREGVHNFFATFIEVLKDRDGDSIEVEKGTTSGDFLQGFFLGTRDALYDNGRQSITITIREVTPEAVGQLIALFERAVGLYASLVNINAYHQPGVEAGKEAAATVLDIEQKVIAYLRAQAGTKLNAATIAQNLNLESQTELIFKLLNRLAVNPRRLFVEMKDPVHKSLFYFK